MTDKPNVWLVKYVFVISVPLSPARPSRHFSVQKALPDSVDEELKEHREQRAARFAQIEAADEVNDKAARLQRQKEEARLAEEK